MTQADYDALDLETQVRGLLGCFDVSKWISSQPGWNNSAISSYRQFRSTPPTRLVRELVQSPRLETIRLHDQGFAKRKLLTELLIRGDAADQYLRMRRLGSLLLHPTPYRTPAIHRRYCDRMIGKLNDSQFSLFQLDIRMRVAKTSDLGHIVRSFAPRFHIPWAGYRSLLEYTESPRSRLNILLVTSRNISRELAEAWVFERAEDLGLSTERSTQVNQTQHQATIELRKVELRDFVPFNGTRDWYVCDWTYPGKVEGKTIENLADAAFRATAADCDRE